VGTSGNDNRALAVGRNTLAFTSRNGTVTSIGNDNHVGVGDGVGLRATGIGRGNTAHTNGDPASSSSPGHSSTFALGRNNSVEAFGNHVHLRAIGHDKIEP
jgi:hypothetical protein